MGGNNYITQAARDQSEPKQLDYGTACEALDLEPEPNGKKVLVVCDVGATVYRLCLESSFPFGSSSFFIQLVTRLFTRTVLPILYAFPNVECVLCFDACHNDLKEKYKGLRMNEDDFMRRKPGLVRAQAINFIVARLVNAVFPILYELEQAGIKLLFVNDPVVNLNGKIEGTFVVPLDICAEKQVHPQLLPLWAATITNDKSPGYPGIDALEQGLTPDWIRDLFTALLDGGSLNQFESRERTDERIEEIIAGTMDSVRGLPEFFKNGKNRAMLERSQVGESILKKVGSGAADEFVEEDVYAFIYPALGGIDLSTLLSAELAHLLANKILDTGIEIAARLKSWPPCVVAPCTVSELKTALPFGFYIGRSTKLARALNKIRRGMVRRLRGMYQNSETGSLQPVTFFVRSMNGGYAAVVVPRSESSASPGGSAASPVAISDNTSSDVPDTNAANLATITTGAGSTLTTTDCPSTGAAAAAAAVSSLPACSLEDEDSLEDDYDLVDLNAAEPECAEVEDELAPPLEAPDLAADNNQRAADQMGLAERRKLALVVQNIDGQVTLVLWRDTQSFLPCDANLLTVIENSFVPFELARGIQASSPRAVARSRILTGMGRTLCFDDYWPLSKTLRALKKSNRELFFSYHTTNEANLIRLSVLVGVNVVDNKPTAFKRTSLVISVPTRKNGNVEQISMFTSGSSAGFPADAFAVEFGVDKDGKLAARFLSKAECRQPPWKLVLGEFRAVTVKDCVAALINSSSIEDGACKVYKIINEYEVGILPLMKSVDGHRQSGEQQRNVGRYLPGKVESLSKFPVSPVVLNDGRWVDAMPYVLGRVSELLSLPSPLFVSVSRVTERRGSTENPIELADLCKELLLKLSSMRSVGPIRAAALLLGALGEMLPESNDGDVQLRENAKKALLRFVYVPSKDFPDSKNGKKMVDARNDPIIADHREATKELDDKKEEAPNESSAGLEAITAEDVEANQQQR